MSVLTIEEFAVLVHLLDGPRTLAELSRVEYEVPNKRTSFVVMHLEQSKLIHGFGLPKTYGILTEGERAVREFRERVMPLVTMSNREWD